MSVKGKPPRDIAEVLEAEGWEFDGTTGGAHCRWSHPRCERFMYTAMTPSDKATRHNVRSTARMVLRKYPKKPPLFAAVGISTDHGLLRRVVMPERDVEALDAQIAFSMFGWHSRTQSAVIMRSEYLGEDEAEQAPLTVVLFDRSF